MLIVLSGCDLVAGERVVQGRPDRRQRGDRVHEAAAGAGAALVRPVLLVALDLLAHADPALPLDPSRVQALLQDPEVEVRSFERVAVLAHRGLAPVSSSAL